MIIDAAFSHYFISATCMLLPLRHYFAIITPHFAAISPCHTLMDDDITLFQFR
jgi:hypothetical protein